jgi:hypothetical protein
MNKRTKSISTKKIQNILNLFKFLTTQKKQNLSSALSFLDADSIEHISETIYNLLYNEKLKKSMTSKQKNKIVRSIKPNLKSFEYIAKKHFPVSNRKKKILQSGSGLGLILSALIPLIGSLLLKK